MKQTSRIQLRIPTELRQRLEAQASKNKRTLSSEIRIALTKIINPTRKDTRR